MNINMNTNTNPTSAAQQPKAEERRKLWGSILRNYWGYADFRGIQLQIIESIANGHDTLGLMPTGGGKSITFQVPALATKRSVYCGDTAYRVDERPGAKFALSGNYGCCHLFGANASRGVETSR